MEIVERITDMQRHAEQIRTSGRTIALVPTLGYLHEGHLSLIRLARTKADLVVTSIFVNPTQFGPNEDLDNYPRNLERDRQLAEQAGCDLIFAPHTFEMYPEDYQTFVQVEDLTRGLCGRSRPSHFRGVTTVVTKLFNIVKPHIAVFGQKDAQQALVLSRMVSDLNFDVEIIVAPIVRSQQGLALSSRNDYLSDDERDDALVLYHSLKMADALIHGGERNAAVLKKAVADLIRQKNSARIDYIEFVDPNTLRPVTTVQNSVMIALAVYIGKARLIDNMIIKA